MQDRAKQRVLRIAQDDRVGDLGKKITPCMCFSTNYFRVIPSNAKDLLVSWLTELAE